MLDKFFIIDALALIYRAHYAFIKNPMVNKKGFNTSVIFGFTNSLIDILENQKPNYLSVAFDTPEPTFRHIEYKKYKSNREAQPEIITDSIKYIKKIISAFNIPILEFPGYEADDVIGSLIKYLSNEDFEIYIVTPDKDFGQLVKKNIYLFKPGLGRKRHEILSEKDVKEKWDVKDVHQITDILGLWGDSVDCIPGVPSIGEKTAKKLISEFNTVENLLDNTENLKGKIKENLLNFKEQALISKKLATIDNSINLNFNLAKAQYSQPNKPKLFNIFKELEFNSISKRIFGAEDFYLKDNFDKQTSLFKQNKINNKNNKNVENISYTTISNIDELSQLYDKLKNIEKFGFKTIMNTVNPHRSILWSITIFHGDIDFYYLDFKQIDLKNDKVLILLNKIFYELNILKICENIKNDIIILARHDIKLNNNLFDIQIAHHLLEPELKKDINTISSVYLNKEFSYNLTYIDTIDDNIISKTCKYAQIYYLLETKIFEKLKKQNLLDIYLNLEIPTARTLSTMELNGVTLNIKFLDKLSFEIYTDVKKIENNIYQLVGETFNISSPKQLGEILFDKLKIIENPQKTKTGQYATGENILSKLHDPSGIIKLVLKYKTLLKLKTTYIDALPDLISKDDGRIHTTYNQINVATGRLSSNNPNLQNIPIKGEEGRKIRQAFIPRNKNFTILSADYSQIELRIIASFAKDKTLVDAFSNNEDIHIITASKIFNVEQNQVTKSMRDKAKTINYSIIYGISSFGLSQVLDIKRSEAKYLIDSYFKNFSDIKIYFENIINKAKKDGFVKTLLGKKRILDGINSRNSIVRKHAERNAINSPIQGTQAEMIKIAMVNIHKWMNENNVKSKMTMQVHDELVFDIHNEEVDLMKKNIKKYMESAIKLAVPVKVNIKIGKNWLDMQP